MSLSVLSLYTDVFLFFFKSFLKLKFHKTEALPTFLALALYCDASSGSCEGYMICKAMFCLILSK